MHDRVVAELRAELEAAAPDDWPGVMRAVTARRTATELLAALDRPPRSCSRLGWELRTRLLGSQPEKEAA
jgi:hypothetical protein